MPCSQCLLNRDDEALDGERFQGDVGDAQVEQFFMENFVDGRPCDHDDVSLRRRDFDPADDITGVEMLEEVFRDEYSLPNIVIILVSDLSFFISI